MPMLDDGKDNKQARDGKKGIKPNVECRGGSLHISNSADYRRDLGDSRVILAKLFDGTEHYTPRMKNGSITALTFIDLHRLCYEGLAGLHIG